MAAEITLSLYNLKQYVDQNAYVHPVKHECTMIEQDKYHRFVSDFQIANWNAKAETELASTVNKGLMSAKDKEKLDSIDLNAEVNQYAFSTFLVDGTYISSDKKSDIIELAGDDNINIYADVVQDKITFSLVGNVPSAANALQLEGHSSSYYAVATHAHAHTSVPEGVTKDTDTPNMWPSDGIIQFNVTTDMVKDQPSPYGMITHFASSSAKYQIWHVWNHPNGARSGKMYQRNAAEMDSVWGTWVRIAEFDEIPTTLPANGGNSDTVDGIHASELLLKNGDSLNGIFDLNKAKLSFTGKDEYSASIELVNYDKYDWLTFKFGNSQAEDRIRFLWDGNDGKYPVLDILNNEIKSYKNMTIDGKNVVALGEDGKIAERFLPDRALLGDGGVPIGSIIPWSSQVIPNGWIECNGQYLNRIDFPELFDKIGEQYNAGDGVETFGIPDLRGEFIRGWDNSRGVDYGRQFATFQADELRSHTHSVNESGDDVSSDGKYIDSIATNNSKQPINSNVVNHTGGNETRPRNIALIYIIKAKNVVGTDPTVRDANAAYLGGLKASAFSLATHTTHLGEEILFEDNGYKKMSDGFIIQWGRVGDGESTAIGSTGTSGSINFPVAFPKQVFCVTAMVDDNVQYNFININNTTNTSFKWRSINADSSLCGSDRFFWMAIGC